MAKLVFQDPKTGQMRHVTLSFIGGPVSVGRNKSNVVAIKHRSISRYHGRLRFENGEHFYDDLKSSNGSFVNGERVTTRKLEDGTTLRLGDVTLEFSIRKMPTLELLPLEPEPVTTGGVDGNDESTYTLDLPEHMRREAAEHGDMTFVPGLSGGPSRDLETLKERAIERAQVNRPWESDAHAQEEPGGLEEHTYTTNALDLNNFPEDTFEQEPPKGLAALLEQAGVAGVEPDEPDAPSAPALPSPPPLKPEPEPEPAVASSPAPPIPTPSSTGAVLGRIKLRSFKAAKELEKEAPAPEASAPTPAAKPKPLAAPSPPEPLTPEPDASVSGEIEPFADLEEQASFSPGGGRLGASVNALIGESPEDIVGPATSVLKIDPIAAANAWIKSTAEGDAVARPAPAPEPESTHTADASSEDVAALKARIQELEMKISELELERDNAREIADVIRRNAARLVEALED